MNGKLTQQAVRLIDQCDTNDTRDADAEPG